VCPLKRGKEGYQFMSPVDEVLTLRVGSARARFLDDIALALKDATSGEAVPDSPSRADIESALKAQIGHGKQLLEMAEAACRDLGSYVKLQPTVHKVLIGALSEAARSFRDLDAMVANWTHRHGQPLEGAEEFSPLARKLDDRRAELIAAWHDVFPGLEVDRVSQAIRNLDAGKGRPLHAVLADLPK
jgi:hypothetical protein